MIDVLTPLLLANVVVNVNGRRSTVSALHAIVLQVVQKALAKEPRGWPLLLKCLAFAEADVGSSPPLLVFRERGNAELTSGNEKTEND